MIQITFTQLLGAMQTEASNAASGFIGRPGAGRDEPDERRQAIARYSRLYEECAQEYCDIHGLRYDVNLMSPIVIEGAAETAADVLADIADLFRAKASTR